MQLKAFDPSDDPNFPKLRDYQEKLRQDLFDAIRAGNTRIMAYAATGSGKTIIAGRIVYDAAILKGRRVLFVVHRDVLIKQSLAAFQKFGLTCGIIAGNYPEDRKAQVQIASVQTLSSKRRRWRDWFTPDLIIADECHITSWGAPLMALKPRLEPGEGKRSVCRSHHLEPYLKAIGVETADISLTELKGAYKAKMMTVHPDLNPNDPDAKTKTQAVTHAWDILQQYPHLFKKESNGSNSLSQSNSELTGIYIGLTATPWRLKSKEEMGDLFECLVSAPMPCKLIEKGILAKPIYFGVEGADLKDVKTSEGDYNQDDLELVCNTPDVIARAVVEWLRLARDRLTIAFAVGVDHARAIAKAFNEAGIPAASVDGSMSTDACDRIYDQLAKGEILVLASAEKLGEGFDVPAVSCILLSRPTKSKAKYFQQLGRGLRQHPDKQDCVVLDQAGNVPRFGFVEDLKEIALRRTPETKIDTKMCPECRRLVPTTTAICPHCGYSFNARNNAGGEEKEKIEYLDDLKLLMPKEDRERYKWLRTQLKRSYTGYLAGRRSLTPLEITIKYRQTYRLGHPPDNWKLHAVFEKPTQEDFKRYEVYLNWCGLKDRRPFLQQKAWNNKQLILEFGQELFEYFSERQEKALENDLIHY